MSQSENTAKQISSAVLVNSTAENVWDKITDVDIERFRFPWYFRLMNIPKPIGAQILVEGVGGKRVAHFDNGKSFTQEIITWEKYRTYSFTFTSTDTFKAGYFFNIFQGAFQISKGTYFITSEEGRIKIELLTDYSLSKRSRFFLNKPVFLILTVFQKYLLNTIKVNSEN